MSTENLTAFIFARAGSKGVRNKNIRLVAGKPLIGHAIETILASRAVERVMVSTDSEEIANTAKDFGADILIRPADLAADGTPEILAWRHAIEKSGVFDGEAKQELFLSFPATSPLRSADDIDHAIHHFRKGTFDIVFGIAPSHANPYLSMAKDNADGTISLFMEESRAMRRQDTPNVYDITSCVYVTTPAYVRQAEKLIDGRTGAIQIPPERALDIDTEFDLHMADLLLRYPFQGEKT